jgi:putative tricarboxylic transport membrane protein
MDVPATGGHPEVDERPPGLRGRVRELAPYGLVLAGAAFFYYKADRFIYEPQSGRIGPDSWPKLLLVCLIVVCVFEIARRALVMAGALAVRRPALDISESPSLEAELAEEQAHPASVAAAVLVTVAYLLLLETVGFFIATFVYTAALMWIGQFRRVAWNLTISFLFTFAFMFAFMRIIFVDLPLGVEPFAKVSTALMRLMGIH